MAAKELSCTQGTIRYANKHYNDIFAVISELFRFVQFETGRRMNKTQWYSELGKFRLLMICPLSFHVLRKISFSRNSPFEQNETQKQLPFGQNFEHFYEVYLEH